MFRSKDTKFRSHDHTHSQRSGPPLKEAGRRPRESWKEVLSTAFLSAINYRASGENRTTMVAVLSAP